MQLKIKPSVIIQEMQKDKKFMKLTEGGNEDEEAKPLLSSQRRQRTVTEHDLDRITRQSIDSERFKGNSSRITSTKARMILAESKLGTPRNLRLDSSINPRKSIVLDISIMDKSNGGPKTVTNKASHILYENSKVVSLQSKATNVDQIEVGKLYFRLLQDGQATQRHNEKLTGDMLSTIVF